MVPGDIWTCDTLSTESPPPHPSTRRHETSVVVPTDLIVYSGAYTRDPSEFSETIDSSYVVDDITDSPTEAATPYPLIEFDVSNDHANDGARNASYHKKENYPHAYTSDRRPLPLPLMMQKYKDVVSDHCKLLNELTSRLHVYKELSAAISDSLSVEDATTANPIRAAVAVHNRRQNISLNYLVRGYIEGNELRNDTTGRPIATAGSGGATTDGYVATSTSTGGSATRFAINDLDPDNSVIAINDDLGNKRYLTIDRYKTVAWRLTSRQSVSVVPCSRHVRLPNRTDCERYYTCDPKTAVVLEYSCPPHTAFSVYSRICDKESAKTCRTGGKPTSSEVYAERVEHPSSRDENSEEEEEEEEEEEQEEEEEEDIDEERLCREHGKMKDPTSDFNYYICYSMPGSEEIKSVRMTCPNALIFCRSKRVCTTRRLCDEASR